MYAPSFGNYQGGQAPPTFNQAGPPQQPHQQHMMFNNAQQFPGAAPPHANPYGGNPNQMNPNMMMPNGGMMQNGGMAHMSGGNGLAPSYQTPYNASPYGQNITPSSSAGPSHQGPFMPPTSNAGQFMNQNMGTPQMMQRMQPPPVTPITTNQRASPFNGTQHNTPPSGAQQSQFMTPQNANMNQQAQGNNQTNMQNTQANQTPQSAGGQTPQTPSFPNNAPPASGMAPPLSPGAENREKSRVTVLLEINRELLIEIMRLQGVQADAKKEAESSADAKKAEMEKAKAAATSKEWADCMKRLSANLSYLAAAADRSHKPSSQIPPNPAIMIAPVLTILPKNKPATMTKKTDSIKVEDGGSDSKKVGSGDDLPSSPDRIEILQGLYKQLQALFPNVKDYTKEMPMPQANPKAKQSQGQAQSAAAGQAQGANPKPVAAQMQQQTPRSSSQPQQQQNAASQQPNSNMNPNMAALQAHQQQAQQFARQQQQQAQMMNASGQQAITSNMGAFNPNMMAMNAMGNVNMSMNPMGNMMMPGMQGINTNSMGYGGGQGMMGPGQGMNLGGMNPGMMGMGMQPPQQQNNGQQGAGPR